MIDNTGSSQPLPLTDPEYRADNTDTTMKQLLSQMEPQAVAMGSRTLIVTANMSTAISLKRIADVLEWWPSGGKHDI